MADSVTQTAQVKKPKRTMLAAAVIVLLLAAYWFSLSTQYDLLPVGSPAPSFTLTAADGSQVSLVDSGRHGRSAILVFYPGDNTAVCTAQLCALRDSWSEVKAAGADVYGINPASQETHQDFARRNRYPFPLLVDARRPGPHPDGVLAARQRTHEGFSRSSHLRRPPPQRHRSHRQADDQQDAVFRLRRA